MRGRLVVAAIVLLLLLTAGTVVWVTTRSLPDAPQARTGYPIGAPVEIRYDHRRRPFVAADSLADALFAQGWLHARERLWQMELLRRAGLGRMAQALGPALLDTDRQLWRAGVPQLAETLAGNAEAMLVDQIGAYVAGVNAGMSTLARWPPEFLLVGFEPRPWRPRDVFAVGALVAFQAGNNMSNELLRLALAGVLDDARFRAFLPELAVDAGFPYVLAGSDVAARAGSALAAADTVSAVDGLLFPNAGLGSNGWVVAPSRSRSGRVLFAFDSHDDLSLPNLFYEVHLFFPPGRALRGWSVAGMPGVVNGYNDRLAWGLTNIGDTQDLFVEERHPEDPRLLKGPDGWYPVRLIEVDIPVAGRRSPERLAIEFSRHGPLIHDDPPVALRWTGHQVGNLGMDAFLAMNLATDWESFNAAADRLPAPSSNVTYADRDGNIGFRTIGLLPLRARGDGLVPLPGAAPDNGWSGFLPAGMLPRRLNPPSGYLAAANAQVAPAGQVLVSADNAPGYRMRRLRAALGGGGTLSLDDMQRLQTDWYNAQAALLLPGLLPALAGADFARRGETVLAEAVAVLQAWLADPVNDRQLAAPAIFESFYVALADEVFGSGLPDDLLTRLKANNYVLNHALDRLLLEETDSPWWRGDRDAVVVDAFRAAVAATAAALGPVPSAWHWEDRLQISFEHELGAEVPVVGAWLLNRGPYPWGGGPATLGRARYRYHQPFRARAGATVRVVAELGQGGVVRAIMPGGQAGHPLSRHYADQLPAWLAGDLDVIPGTFAEVAGDVDRLQP